MHLLVIVAMFLSFGLQPLQMESNEVGISCQLSPSIKNKKDKNKHSSNFFIKHTRTCIVMYTHVLFMAHKKIDQRERHLEIDQ